MTRKLEIQTDSRAGAVLELVGRALVALGVHGAHPELQELRELQE